MKKRQPNFAETLRRTSGQLKAIRKGVADAGRIEEMHEIDALVGVAKDVADRQLARVLADTPDGSVDDERDG